MDIPRGPKGRFLIGNLHQFRGDRLAFFTHCARTYGDIVPFKLGPYRCLLLSDPELIDQVFVTNAKLFVKHFGLRMYKPVLGNGLVTSEGDFWRRQRKLSAPAFQPSRMAAYAEVMCEATERILAQWGSDGVRDVHADMTQLTLEIACKTLFGADASADAEIVGQSLNTSMEVIGARMRKVIRAPLWLPTPANLRLWKSMRVLDGIVSRIITDGRKAPREECSDDAPSGAGQSLLDPAPSPGTPGEGWGEGPAPAKGAKKPSPYRSPGVPGEGTEPLRVSKATAPRSDLLSILLRQQDDDGSVMTNRQLLDEARTLFVAGHETTALTLTYALYLLAQNPDVQTQLQTEVTKSIGNRPPQFPDIPALRAVRNVVYESLRLYPPADVLGREAIDDCTVAGIDIPKGMNIFASTWVLHRDVRFFKDPQRFDPSRWTDEFEKSLPRFAYFPFGAGPRFCIGQSFAIIEATLALAAIMQRFSFAPDPTFTLELWPAITLRPRNGVRLTVSDRARFSARTSAMV